MSAKKTRENSVFGCCSEAMNFFVPNRTPGKLYLRCAASFSVRDHDFEFVQPMANRVPTGRLCPPCDPARA